MKQVAQNFNTGRIQVLDVPTPTLSPGCVLVRTEYSLLSAGTEKSKVDLGRKSLAGKAKARPDLVRQVLGKVRTEGLGATIRTVRNRLDALSPLGYSCAGVVERVAPGVSNVKVGDRVACAGAEHAVHAGYVCVPELLCARVPDDVSSAAAAFTTVGCVAMHGVRQAGAAYGERVLVIGLGLIGQITVRLLKASGCFVAGVDVSDFAVAQGLANGCDLATRADTPGTEAALMDFAEGAGFDAVVITAGAGTNAPFLLAGEVARDRATVVLVGATPIEIPRSPFYEKELTLVMSRSYGPGRYDPSYEIHGHDYPDGFVRWTEGRNMSSFLAALSRGDVDAERLTTHRFPVDHAERAYELLANGDEPYLGILLEYSEEPLPQTPVENHVPVRRTGAQDGVVFVGAGNFATRVLLPAFRKAEGLRMDTIVSAHGLTAVDAARKFGFERAESDAARAFGREGAGVAVIATRHDTHATLVVDALRAGLDVFVEKPLCLRRSELRDIVAARQGCGRLCIVGFNRRFAPMTRRLMEERRRVAGPVQCLIRVNAGPIEATHWIQDPEIGGGRIVGEMCHFVDLAVCLAASPVVRVFATGLGNGKGAELQDSVSVSLTHQDGSVTTILYTSDGDPAFPKERVELFGGGMVGTIEDFRESMTVVDGRARRSRGAQDKGHAAEVAAFVAGTRGGHEIEGLSFEDCVHSTITTFAVIESLETGAPVEITEFGEGIL